MRANKRKIVIAGGSGFLGRLLVDWFTREGWQVVVLSRAPAADLPAHIVAWDGRTLGPWTRELDGCRALVNLAGRSVNCRYHARNRRLMMDSRVESTRVLAAAVRAAADPPRVWLNSSTATIYKHSLDRAMDEASGQIGGTPAAKDVFSVEVAQAWEDAFDEAITPGTRKVVMRTAMVLGTQPGTVFRVLRRLARLGLGGSMDRGRQYVSWLHQIDFCRAVEWLIEHEEINGVVNLAAPAPVTNRELMQIMRACCHMPFGLPARRWMLEAGAVVLRTETELVIKSRRVVPGRLLEAGFTFQFPDVASAVADLERRLTTNGHRIHWLRE